METAMSTRDTRTLQERALQEHAEVQANIAREQQERADREREHSLTRFAYVLSKWFGVDYEPADLTITLDGVTLKYRYWYGGYEGNRDIVSMAVPCKQCGTGTAWQEVSNLYDVGRVLHGERWGSWRGKCVECFSAEDEAREAATTDNPAYMQPAPTATDRLVQALVDVLREHGYSTTRNTGEEY